MGTSAFEMTRRLRERGEESRLCAPIPHSAPTSHVDPSWLVRLPTLIHFGNASALFGIEKEMKKADIVHLHYPFFGTAEAVAQYCLLHRKPLVMTFHMDATAGFPFNVAFGMYRVLAQPAILRACKKIFVSSFDYADHSSVADFKKSHPDLFIELPFGVDRHRFSPGERDRSRFGLPNDAFVVGMAGAMDHAHGFKGVEILISAMAKLPASVHALFVGDGALRRVYEARAKDLGVVNRCHFAGRVSDEDLASAYRAMDVFASPSTSAAEAFGIAPAEAMSCGVPAIASDLPGLRSVVRDKETGIIVPPKDANALAQAIQIFVDDPALRHRMSESAAMSAKSRFSWDRHVDTLIREYKKLIVS